MPSHRRESSGHESARRCSPRLSSRAGIHTGACWLPRYPLPLAQSNQGRRPRASSEGHVPTEGRCDQCKGRRQLAAKATAAELSRESCRATCENVTRGTQGSSRKKALQQKVPPSPPRRDATTAPRTGLCLLGNAPAPRPLSGLLPPFPNGFNEAKAGSVALGAFPCPHSPENGHHTSGAQAQDPWPLSKTRLSQGIGSQACQAEELASGR